MLREGDGRPVNKKGGIARGEGKIKKKRNTRKT